MPRKVRLKNIIKCQRCLRISPLLEQGGGAWLPSPSSCIPYCTDCLFTSEYWITAAICREQLIHLSRDWSTQQKVRKKCTSTTLKSVIFENYFFKKY